LSHSGSASTTEGPRAGRIVALWRRHSYLAVLWLAVLTACPPRRLAVAPASAFSPSTAEALTDMALRTVPSRYQIVRISWRSDDGRLQLGGSGAARIAPPDSLRADIAASLGLGRATMILTGDEAVSQPAAVVDQVLPDRFALWAALGIMRPPGGIVTVERLDDAARTVWRVTDGAGKITIFELNAGALVSVAREEGGRTTSQMRLTRENGEVKHASLTDFGRSLRLEIEITGREPSDAFPPEIWRLRP